MRRPTHHGGATSSRFYGVRWKGYRSRIHCCKWEEANDRGRLCRLDRICRLAVVCLLEEEDWESESNKHELKTITLVSISKI